MKTPKTYLICKNEGIISFSGILPQEIKKSSKIEKKPKTHGLKHTTILNEIARTLGIKDFSLYKDKYKEIESFLKKHSLFENQNLIEPPEIFLHIGDRRQEITDKLFREIDNLPEKILVGKIRYEDVNLPVKDPSFKSLIEISIKLIYQKIKTKESPFRGLLGQVNSLRELKSNINILFREISPAFNYIDNSLCFPDHENDNIIKLYYPNDTEEYVIKKDHERIRKDFTIIKKELLKIPQLWAEIIPFNKNIIFLKRGTKYDYLIKNQRTKKLEIEYPLSSKDATLEQIEMREFKKWYYFNNDLCKEKIEHEAELFYYKSGGQSGKEYFSKGQDLILKEYLERKGYYNPHDKERKISEFSLDNFKQVSINSKKKLYVSDLITIKDFFDFFESSDYKNRRQIGNNEKDDLDNMNKHDDSMNPVSVTWYDANAYCGWFSKKKNKNFRLLTLQEYENIYPIENQVDLGVDIAVEFRSQSNKVININEYDSSEFFESLICKYRANLKWKKNKFGVSFIDGGGFAEWTNSGSVDQRFYVRLKEKKERLFSDMLPSNFMGKYKHCKIGFRLCYEE